MTRRSKRIIVSSLVASLLIAAGTTLLVARMAVFPSWYPQKSIGVRFPNCTSYQKRVYVYCQDPHENLGLDFSDFVVKHTVGSKTIEVKGWWVPHLSPRANIILVHGGGADRRAMLKHVRYLHNAGYQVALIDCHNHGLSTSDGRGISLGLWESESVVAASRWVRAQSSLPLFAMGTSQGGFAVLRAIALPENGLTGVIAENPYISVKRVLLEFPAALWAPEILKKASIYLLRFWIGVPATELDVHLFAQEIGNRPVLLIHPKNDKVVRASHSQEIYDLLPAKPGVKELWITDQGEHEYVWNIYGSEYERRVIQFIESNLKRLSSSSSASSAQQ